MGIVIGNVIVNTTIDGSNPENDSPVDNSTSSVTSPYLTGITVCEIIVILAITLFAMKKLFSTGVISKFDEEDEGGI